LKGAEPPNTQVSKVHDSRIDFTFPSRAEGKKGSTSGGGVDKGKVFEQPNKKASKAYDNRTSSAIESVVRGHVCQGRRRRRRLHQPRKCTREESVPRCLQCRLARTV